MNSKQATLFIEINSHEYIFSVGQNNQTEDFNLVYKISTPLKGIIESKITELDLICNIISKNIYLIEQKINFVFKEVILILDNFESYFINYSGYKKLNGSQLAKENITYIINSLKTKINEIEKDKTILHIFNSKFLLDEKKIDNIPIGLFGNNYCHELSFLLIKNNDYNNLKSIFDKCNLKIKRIISKKFIEGAYLVDNYSDLNSFFKINLDANESQIIFFENSCIKFFENFRFGTNLIINDISKVTALKKQTIKDILLNLKFYTKDQENELIEAKFFVNENFRKIRKKLILDIAKARIQELVEIILIKNINAKSFLKINDNIVLTVNEINKMECLKDNFTFFFSDRNNLALKFIEYIPYKDLFSRTQKLVQYGWNREAIPIVQEKKSIISRIFDLIFN